MWKRQLSTTEMKREEMQNQVHSGGKLIILLEFARPASETTSYLPFLILDRWLVSDGQAVKVWTCVHPLHISNPHSRTDCYR